jgi:predicted DNA-binding transcriptional regulator AlpA
MGDDPLLSLPDAAERFDIPHTTLWRRVKAGDVPSVKVGNSYGVKLSDLARLADELKQRRPPKRRPPRPR